MKINDYRNITFSGAYDDGEALFVSSHIFNGMLKINKTTYQAEYVCMFKENKTDEFLLHYKVVRYGEYFVFVPNNAKGLYLYHLVEGRMSYHPIDKKEAERTRCVSYALKDNKLWLFYAFAEHPAVIFDLDTFEIEYFYGIVNSLPKEISARKKMAGFWSDFTQNNTKVYGVVWKSSYFVEIDLEKKEVQIYDLMCDNIQLSAIACDGETLWLVDANKKLVIKWNKTRGIVGKYQTDEKFLVSRSFYCNIMCCNSKVIILFDDSNSVFCVNEKQESIEVLCQLPEGFAGFEGGRKQWRRFFNYDLIGNVIRIYPTNANMMLEIDVESSSVKGYQYLLDAKYDEDWYQNTIINPYFREVFQDNRFIESIDVSLKEYLRYVMSMDGKND